MDGVLASGKLAMKCMRQLSPKAWLRFLSPVIRALCLFAALSSFSMPAVLMAQEPEIKGSSSIGERGITESVGDIMARDAAHGPKPEKPPKPIERGRNSSKRIPNPDSPKVAQWPSTGHDQSSATYISEQPDLGFSNQIGRAHV